MITEDYVSFETAKLLKEKGFDEPVLKFYDHKGKVAELYYRPQNKSITGDTYKCPTLQMAMKWLRKKHNLYVTSVPNGIGEQIFYPLIYKNYDEYGWIVLSSSLRNGFQDTEFSSPEEACEAAIKYCLKNLFE